MAGLWSIGQDLERILGFGILGEFLEKGNTRKHTEIRVTRCRKMFWRNLAFLR
jgi:hypothetical protein